MKISKRLKAIGDLVEEGSHIIDVGCDHALLDIYVVTKYSHVTAIASDKLPGPIAQAQKNIKQAGLENKIKTQVSDGIKEIGEDTNTLVISGMGGRLMIGILKYRMEKLKNIHTIILSPNSDQSMIRTFLLKHGYYMDEEIMVEDAGHVYMAMKLKKGRKHYTKDEYYFGPVLLQKRGSLFEAYFQKELERRKILVKILPKNYRYRRFQVKKEIKRLEKVLNQKLDSVR